jgi:hypothetical protein
VFAADRRFTRQHAGRGCQADVAHGRQAVEILNDRIAEIAQQRKGRVLRLARAAFGYKGMGKHPVVPVQHERYRSWRIA